MKHLTTRCLALLLLLLLPLAPAAFGADAPDVAAVQGLYEGTLKPGPPEDRFDARVVAVGKGRYKVFVRRPGGVEGTKFEMAATTDGRAIRFTGKPGAEGDWKGEWADGAFKVTHSGNAEIEFKRVVREPPTLGAKPPAGAIVLLDGKNFDEMTAAAAKPKPGEPAPPATRPWKTVEEGAIEVPKGGMTSKRELPGSFKLHVEFKCPLMPEAKDQGRANSGCYLPNGDEIQVLDSFGMTTYTGGGCGGLYRYKDPDTFDEFSLASAPPLQWQTYDVEYTVEKPADGKGPAKARVTVLHNGIKIHDNAELKNPAKPGRLHFQDHGNPVHYRNIWVLPADAR